MKTGRYEEYEDQYLVDHYSVDMSITEIAVALDRSESSVGNRYFKLRSRGLVARPPNSRCNRWTDEQDETLWREIGLTPDEELQAKCGNRTLVALQERAYMIGASRRYNRAAV